MSDYKIGDRVTVKLSGGRLVEAEIKVIREGDNCFLPSLNGLHRLVWELQICRSR